MSPRKPGHREAARLLAAHDPVVARLLEDFGAPSIPASRETPFATLVRSITFQQLAGAAARAIHGRLIAALDGDVTPERLLATPAEILRGCGLSGSKVVALQDLATRVFEGTVVVEPRRLAHQSNEEIIRQLSTVRGIGKWSADMFLLFRLRRMDVWPTGDLAVRKGFGFAWQIAMPTPKELDLLGEAYRPYRSVVAWYCWRAAGSYAAPIALPVPG